MGAPESALQQPDFGASDEAPLQVFYRRPSSPAFGKPIHRHEMHEMFDSATLLGLGVVAVWAYVRYPRLRPQSLVWAALHVAISFTTLLLLPEMLSLLLPLTSTQSSRIFLALALLFPALTYVLLSWVWLIARILDLLGGNPRGGHPVTNEH